jgi:hypothetical protein
MLMDYKAELDRFWNDRMDYDREMLRAIAQCAEWPKVIEMELAWLRDCRKFWGVNAKGVFWDRLATALPVDTGTRPASGASLRRHDLPDGR